MGWQTVACGSNQAWCLLFVVTETVTTANFYAIWPLKNLLTSVLEEYNDNNS